MFVTALYIYLVATTSMSIGMIGLLAFLVDIVAWAAIQNSFEAWATGTTADQEFWKEDE